MAEGEEPLIDRICAKIEDFMFGDTENGGEAIFNNFAAEHHHIFDEECEVEENEQKLE